MEAGHRNIIFIIMVATVALAVFLQLKVLKPKTLNMTEEEL